MNLKILEKSRKLLIQVMGQEDFDKFMEDGKIEIKHHVEDEAGRPIEVIYELDQDARVYNKTKKQSYCIEPICPDNLPLHDQLAIKYGYLKNNIKRVEEVANKRSTAPREIIRENGILEGTLNSLRMRIAGTGDTEMDLRRHHYGTVPDRPRSAGYNDYVEYLERTGWRRSQVTLDENNRHISTIKGVDRNCEGTLIDIVCPVGQKITIMGTQQIPTGADTRIAHSFRARLADENDSDIPYDTRISIVKRKVSEEYIYVARLFYSDINLIINPTDNINSPRLKIDDQWYRFRQGIELNGQEHLTLNAIRPNVNVCSQYTKFAIDCDLWYM